MGSLIAAVRQVGRTGDDAQRLAARAVIDSAVRAIWSILAEGPAAPSEAADTAAGGEAENAPDPAASAQAEEAPSPADGADTASATEA